MSSITFSSIQTVRIDDINFGGHMGHDRLVTLMHQARVEMFTHLGVSEIDVAGELLVMRRLEVKYSHQCFQGDDLKMDMTISQNRASVIIDYEITNQTAGKRAATARCEMTVIDHKSHRPLKPAVFFEAIA